MKRLLPLTLILIPVSCLPNPARSAPPPGHVLAFEDTFDGTTLDAEHWTAQEVARRDAFNSPRAVSVKGGHLVLTTFTEGGKHYTGFIGSRGKFEQAFGYWEARVRCFTTPGMWSAFWAQSPSIGKPVGDVKKAGSEIDIMEHRVIDKNGADIRNLAITTVHWDGYGKEHKSANQRFTWQGEPPLQANWHTYAVHWTRTGYVFYLDGSIITRISEGVSHRPHFIYLTSEVKDQGWAGNIPPGGYGSAEESTTRMEVDWVRVWTPE